MLGQRRKRWANISQTSGRCVVFARLSCRVTWGCLCNIKNVGPMQSRCILKTGYFRCIFMQSDSINPDGSVKLTDNIDKVHITPTFSFQI